MARRRSPDNPEPASQPKTVIVLGAGASKADTAPLQGEVFKRYFERRWQPGHEWDNDLELFFDDFFGIDIHDHDATGSFGTRFTGRTCLLKSSQPIQT